jgi:hypothetical protein
VLGDCSKNPIVLSGLKWLVTITDHDVKIGCEFHSKEDWASFTAREIREMSPFALDFWAKYKTIILSF